MTTSTVRTRYSSAVLEGIAAGERAVLRLVLVRGDAGAVREAAAAALARGEELADVAREREPPLSPIACKPGCSACCSAMVLASPAEVLRIADHLRRTLAPDGIATLLRKVHTAHARSDGLTAAVGRMPIVTATASAAHPATRMPPTELPTSKARPTGGGSTSGSSATSVSS